MVQIVGGVVSYEDGIKTIQGDHFSPTRKVRVELNFSLDASDNNGSSDAAVQTVLDKAQKFVCGKLGIAAPTAAAVATTGVGEISAPKSEPKAVRAPRKAAETAKRAIPSTEAGDALEVSGPTKADLERAAGVPEEGLPGKGSINLRAQQDDELVTSNEKPAPKPDPNDLSDLMASAVPPPITDADLNDFSQKAMQRINKPENPGGPRIRALISEFFPAGTQPVLAKIPQEKRHEFKAKLEALK